MSQNLINQINQLEKNEKMLSEMKSKKENITMVVRQDFMDEEQFKKLKTDLFNCSVNMEEERQYITATENKYQKLKNYVRDMELDFKKDPKKKIDD